MKFLRFERLHGTFALSLIDKKKKIINCYFIQFSFKEPYKYPHRESMFGNRSWICGWLFFYFGNIITE